MGGAEGVRGGSQENGLGPTAGLSYCGSLDAGPMSPAEVGGQVPYTHKMGSVSWLNERDMFIPHLWALHEF